MLRSTLIVAATLLSSLLSLSASGQQLCGAQLFKSRLEQKYPGAKAQMRQGLVANVANAKNTAAKTTAILSPVPVVFHIVLTQDQVDELGGVAGVDKRVQSQVRVLNEDFNAQNSDSTNIPSYFKPYYGKADIQFGTAHRTPDGKATPGYEIIIINEEGTEYGSSFGSGESFADAKYTNGQPNAWNTEQYLNVWIVNPVFDGQPIELLGITTPPMAVQMFGFPTEELGVVLHYGVFGKREAGLDNFIMDGGRTMTHEAGHYFGLWHIWGDDDGLCTNNGGEDDEIDDTPEQTDASYNCFTGKHFDDCTPSGTGTMYMNHMDYSYDGCVVMFSTQQAGVMHSMIEPGGESHTLTQHPELLEWPVSVGNVSAEAILHIYPNPTNGLVHIGATSHIKDIAVVDLTGRKVDIAITETTSGFTVDMSAKPKGVYILQCNTATGMYVEKIILQ